MIYNYLYYFSYSFYLTHRFPKKQKQCNIAICAHYGYSVVRLKLKVIEKKCPLTAEGGRHLNKFVNGLFDDELAAVLYDNSPIGCIDALSR